MYIREDDKTNSAIDLMLDNDNYQEEPYVGCFWYDFKKNELFGVGKTLAIDVPFYHSSQFNTDIKTGRALHKSIWSKEQHRQKDMRFSGDYTKVPRGRVFEFKDDTFRVYVGDWIDKYPQAKKEIIDEFQLPDNTLFVKDQHWDLGRGWSDEYM